MSRSPLSEPIDFARHQLLRGITRVDHARSHSKVLSHTANDRRRTPATQQEWWGDNPRWYPGGTPPRQHNRVTPLIHGDTYFAALKEELDQARHYVYIIGWCLTPHIPLGRDSQEALIDTQLVELLSKTAGRVPVRVLLWSGAPFLIEPTTKKVRAAQEALERNVKGDFVCRLDSSAHWTHCHHQKAVVVDGQVAFVGGMDLTTFSGDRWDTAEHPLRAGQNWHDVQVRIEGEAVADVEHNFRQRWRAVTGEDDLPHREPEYDQGWKMPVQIVRTVPSGTYPFAPDGEFAIFHTYMQLIGRARKLIYIENQYIWSPYVMRALISAMNARHSEPFRIVIVLPAFAGDGRWDNDKHVQMLRDADKGRGIVSIYSPFTSGPNMGETPFTYRAVYVHAKVAVIDDEWLTVGSANLNNRGLITDGEMNAVIHDANLARQMRVKLWAEHLAMPEEQVEKSDPVDLIDHAWPGRAAENAVIVKRGERPLAAPVHKYTVGHKPSDLVLEDAQSLTFEH